MDMNYIIFENNFHSKEEEEENKIIPKKDISPTTSLRRFGGIL